MGRAGDHTFMLRMGVGFEAVLKERTSPELKQSLGAFAYVLSGLGTLFAPQMSQYTIDIDGTSYTRDGVACIVANSGQTGIAGISLAHGIDVSDGLLDVIVVSETTLPMLWDSASSVASGDEPLFEHWSGRAITIHSLPTREVTCDGEDAGFTPIDVSVIESAIGVLVGPEIATESVSSAKTAAETTPSDPAEQTEPN